MINVYHNSIDDRLGADNIYQSTSGNNVVGDADFFFCEKEIIKKKIGNIEPEDRTFYYKIKLKQLISNLCSQ